MISAEYSKASLIVPFRRMARRWRPPAAVFVGMFGLVTLITILLPNQYQSKVKILVKNARLNPIVSLDQQTQGVLYVDEVSESRINTEIELLTSTDVLREVVTGCHLGELVNSPGLSASAKDDVALRQLQKDLKVSAIRKSNVIEVTYQSPDPRRSASVVQTLSNLYLEAHLKLHGAPGSYDFFQQLSTSYLGDLRAAESELADFRRVHRIVALPDEKTLALQQTTDLEKSLVESQAATRRSGQQANQLKTIMDTTPATIEKERRSLPNQYSAEQLATLLITLKNKRSEAVQRYRPDDRIVQELDAQVAQTESAFIAARDSRAQEISTGTNPTLLSAQSEYIRASTDFAGGRAQTQELTRELKDNRARLAALDTATVPYQEMVRRVKQFEDLTEFYKKKSDEARVNDLLDRQRISNVTIAEQPVQSALPSSPRHGLILSLGFVWSLLVSLAIAFMIDLLTERISTPYELEQVPGLPLLAAIPSLAIAPSFSGAFPAVYMSMQRRLSDSTWSHL